MKWSRYAKFFKSKRNGWLLYNSAANSFLKVDNKTAKIIKEIIKNPDEFDYSKTFSLYFQLRSNGFLVENNQDQAFANILKMNRLASTYSNSTLSLTLAPTINCNFGCPYCYEANKTKSLMSDKTVEKLLNFISLHKSAQRLFLVWYGGEPLMAREKIEQINEGIKEIGKPYTSEIITNGYYLTPEVIGKLNDWQIKKIQITIDGDRQTHDRRRFLIGGGKTFDKIIANIDNLLNSDWGGELHLRVNVDTTNRKQFAKVYHFFHDRYDEETFKKVYVYPGFVIGDIENPNENPDISGCLFDAKTKGEFVAKLAQEEGIYSLPIFPKTYLGGCVLITKNAYVIGPDGEIYKCWHDMGEKDKVIGNIGNSTKLWNTPLLAEGMIQGNYLNDQKCVRCSLFPVCNGGCPQVRMYNQRDGKNRDNCSYFSGNLEELLEIHYEQKQKKDNVLQ